MRKRAASLIASITAALTVAALAPAAPAAAAPSTAPPLRVMTQNLYLGSSLQPAERAEGAVAFLAAVDEIYATVQATDFTVRARGLAAQMKAARPDIIGLQEVTKYTTRRNVPGPDLPQYDFLPLLLDALRAEGLDYRVVGVVENALIAAPIVRPDLGCVSALPSDCSVTLLDRGVILANARTKGLTWKGVRSGRYATQASLASPLGPISYDRGWISAEFSYRGTPFRLVNTHLETEAYPAVQEAQARELLAGPAKAKGRVVLTGDMNSAADGSTTASYRMITRSFADAWRPGRDGRGLAEMTCCQASALTNPTSLYATRIDLVLSRGGVTSLRAVRTNDAAFRAEQPLWASDHAGVVATLRLR